MRKHLRTCLLCVLACVEPTLHALGVPHPEGISTQAVNVLLTWQD